MKLPLLVLLVSVLVPSLAFAEPPSPSAAAPPSDALREDLEWQRFSAQVGVGLGAAVLLGGGIAAYGTHTMCDDFPDPADDCGIVQTLSWIGTSMLLSLGAVTVVFAGLGWAIAQEKLDALDAAPSVGLRVDDEQTALVIGFRF